MAVGPQALSVHRAEPVCNVLRGVAIAKRAAFQLHAAVRPIVAQQACRLSHHAADVCANQYRTTSSCRSVLSRAITTGRLSAEASY